MRLRIPFLLALALVLPVLGSVTLDSLATVNAPTDSLGQRTSAGSNLTPQEARADECLAAIDGWSYNVSCCFQLDLTESSPDDSRYTR